MKNNRTTAALEFMLELERNPEFQERQRRLAEQRMQNERQYAEAARGLLEELAKAGLEVEELAELEHRAVDGEAALPVLLQWLPVLTYHPLKMDVIAALRSSWARPDAIPALIAEYRRANKDGTNADATRWAIGGALERVADESVVDDLIDLAREETWGEARGQTVLALGSMQEARERVIPVLIDLLSDEDVAGYAVMALARLEATEASAHIKPLRKHPVPWVRREAKQAFARLRR